MQDQHLWVNVFVLQLGFNSFDDTFGSDIYHEIIHIYHSPNETTKNKSCVISGTTRANSDLLVDISAIFDCCLVTHYTI